MNFLALPPDALPSLVLAGVWFSVLWHFRFSGYGIAFLSLGATMLHEACHAVVGFLLGAKPVSVSLWPHRSGDHWMLGSVGFTNLNIWNSAFVGFAPLLMLPLGWALFTHWMVPAYESSSYVSWLIAGYFTAGCLFACMPSSTDIKVGALSALMYAGAAYLLWKAAP